jgi:hypothetical protein
MNSLIQYLNGGRVEKRSKLDFVELVVTKFSDIEEKILPFFDKYPLQGVKSADYADFCKVVQLMKEKAHLTVSGLEQIRNIYS